MPLPDKFSYILNDNNAIKKLSDLEVVGLSENYFKKYTVEDFLKHIKAVFLNTHPDKNEHSTRSSEAFKYIHAAAQRIKENLKKNNGSYIPIKKADEKDVKQSNHSWKTNYDDYTKQYFEEIEKIKKKLAEDIQKIQQEIEKEKEEIEKEKEELEKETEELEKEKKQLAEESQKTKDKVSSENLGTKNQKFDDNSLSLITKQLRSILLDYKNSSKSETAQTCYNKLIKILDKKTSNKDKIIAFYMLLLENCSKSTAPNAKINYLDQIIIEDKSRSALKFVSGIAAIVAIILTFPISVLFVAAIYYKTGRYPLDLFNTYAKQFSKEIDLINRKDNYFFKTAKKNIEEDVKIPTEDQEDNPSNNFKES